MKMSKWQIRLACLLLAVLVFFVFSYSSRQGRSVTLPLKVILPGDYKADSLIPSEAEFTVIGSEEKIYMIDMSNVVLYADFSGVSEEGIMYAPVRYDFSGVNESLDFAQVDFEVKPSNIRVYFSKKQY